jgi:hypothetical protein
MHVMSMTSRFSKLQMSEVMSLCLKNMNVFVLIYSVLWTMHVFVFNYAILCYVDLKYSFICVWW